MKVLGIDQGIANLGFGIVNEKEELDRYGYITTSSKHSIEERLYKISSLMREIIIKEKPDIISCEKFFFNPKMGNGRNKSASMIYTNMITGIIGSLAGEYNIKFQTYTPGQVKKVICGNGRAKKEEIIEKIEETYKIEIAKTKKEHVCDAVSIALTTVRKEKEKDL